MSANRVIIALAVGAVGLAAAYACIISPIAKKRAESRLCASAVTSICLAAKCWALDHGGVMPTDFLSMSNEVSTPKVLFCLESRRRAVSSAWSEFNPASCTYKIVAPGMHMEETNRVYLRCKIHGHLGYADTTVFDGTRRHGKFD